MFGRRQRVFDYDFLARTGRVRAIPRLARRRVVCDPMHLRQHSADKRRRLEHKMQERLVVRDQLYEIVRLDLPGRRKRGRAIIKSTPFLP